MSALVDLTAGAVANTATKRGGVLPQKGTTAENDAYTGAVGEITYDETLSQYRVHDGSTAGGVKIPVVGIAAPFRGALVYEAADDLAQDYTTVTSLPWDSESYDTDAIHDPATNSERLTVPAGVTKVRVSAGVHVSLLTADLWAFLAISKGGTGTFAYPGCAYTMQEVGTTSAYLNVTSPVLTVAAAEYFECDIQLQTDTSVTRNADKSWFAMEIIN